MENLLQATRNYLRSNWPAALLPSGQDIKNYIGIQPNGHPPANCGAYYVALDDGGVSTGNARNYLREEFTILVTITKRIGHHARDRYDAIYTETSTGLRSIERPIIRLIHGVQDIRVAANTLASTPHADYGDIYQMPLWYAGRSAMRFEGGDWVGSSSNHDQAFAVRTLRFTGGLRVQALDIME